MFALYRDNIYEAKTMVMLAIAVAMSGGSVCFAVANRRCRRTLRILRAADLGPCVSIEDLSIDHAVCGAADELVRYLPTQLDYHTAKRASHEGCAVGVLALSSLIRRTENGSPDLKDPGLRAAYERLLRSAVINVARFRALLQATSPNHVVLREPGYIENGPLVDVALADGCGVVQVSDGNRDDAMLFKRLSSNARRVLPTTVAPSTFARESAHAWTAAHEQALVRAFRMRYGGKWTLQRQYQPSTLQTLRSRAELAATLDIPPASPIAVIFPHILWDATFWGGDDLFESYSEWLAAVVMAAAGNTRVHWVIKAHPANVFRHQRGDVRERCAEMALVRRLLPNIPEHVRVLEPDSPISSLSLYENADFGFTVRGTPGFEMACFGGAVFTAGTGTYAGLGFTYDSSSRDELLDRILHVQDHQPLTPEQVRKAKSYALLLFARRPWRMKTFENSLNFRARGWNPLDWNLVLAARSLSEVQAHGDLERFARWLRGSSDVDYLEPESFAFADGPVDDPKDPGATVPT